MVLSWLGVGGKPVSVGELIARKKYGKAIELLRAQFQAGSRDPRLRLQLADVLVLAGRGKDAVPILQGLADELAGEGSAAKAIVLLKKIEMIEPGRKDVERRLAALIQERPRTEGEPPPPARMALPELDMEAGEEAREPAPEAPPPPVPAPRAAELEPPVPAAAPLEEEVEAELSIESEEAFRDELLDSIQEALLPGGAAAGGDLESLVGERPSVPSPLFSSFNEDELVAVMQGLRLLSYAPGDVIITEGEPGDSLFMLTTGSAKAYVRNADGRHVLVREMPEGSFFGEISILTGKPRTATVTAATACELLELDRKSLDEIKLRHPHVMDVLEDFYRQRAGSAIETQARASRGAGPG